MYNWFWVPHLVPIPRWWFQLFFIFIPILGEDSHFDEHFFQMGWFNHQLDIYYKWEILRWMFFPLTEWIFQPRSFPKFFFWLYYTILIAYFVVALCHDDIFFCWLPASGEIGARWSKIWVWETRDGRKVIGLPVLFLVGEKKREAKTNSSWIMIRCTWNCLVGDCLTDNSKTLLNHHYLGNSFGFISNHRFQTNLSKLT